MKFIFYILFCSFLFSKESADGVVAVVGNHSISKSAVLQSAQMFLLQQGKQSFSSQQELDFLLKEKNGLKKTKLLSGIHSSILLPSTLNTFKPNNLFF